MIDSKPAKEVGLFHNERSGMDTLDVKQLATAIRAIVAEKGLPEDVVISVIEQAIAAAWRREYGERDQNVAVDLNLTDGSAVAHVMKTVVEEPESTATEIDLAAAQAIKPDAQLGKEIAVESHEVTTFGRVAAQTAKQVVLQRLREAERTVILAEFEDKIGTIVTGVVQRVDNRGGVRVEIGKATGYMPTREQIFGEYYPIGSRIKVLIKDIERERGSQLIVSRGSGEFVEYLFRQEVPEMETGAVEIKGVAREAGRRTKLAVYSSLPGIDPVGTFVGGHGTRVQSVMNEIGDQEKIDIITYSDDPAEFIINAMSPAEIISVRVDEEKHRATVTVSKDQQSIAIGRSGQNVRLASRLTGYEIDIEAGEEVPEETKPGPRKNVEDSLFSAIEESSQGEE